MNQLNEFLNLGSSRVRLVDDVRFRTRVRGEKVRAGRPVLVISLYDLNANEKQKLKEIYLKTILHNTVSFYIARNAYHLKSRIGDKILSLTRYLKLAFLVRFITYDYKIPKADTLEIIIQLNDQEFASLKTYLKNVIQNVRKTIGWFSFKGTQNAKGLIHDNRPTRRGYHNCTSWISTAPIGEKGQALLEMLGADRELIVGTNPGWWGSWLTGAASPERLPYVILWSTKPMNETLKGVVSGLNLDWKFIKY